MEHAWVTCKVTSLTQILWFQYISHISTSHQPFFSLTMAISFSSLHLFLAILFLLTFWSLDIWTSLKTLHKRNLALFPKKRGPKYSLRWIWLNVKLLKSYWKTICLEIQEHVGEEGSVYEKSFSWKIGQLIMNIVCNKTNIIKDYRWRLTWGKSGQETQDGFIFVFISKLP